MVNFIIPALLIWILFLHITFVILAALVIDQFLPDLATEAQEDPLYKRLLALFLFPYFFWIFLFKCEIKRRPF